LAPLQDPATEAFEKANMKFYLLFCLVSVSALYFDEEAAKNKPVSKVITLLKDMLKQLKKEAAGDENIYDELACWCETNDKKNQINC